MAGRKSAPARKDSSRAVGNRSGKGRDRRRPRRQVAAGAERDTGKRPGWIPGDTEERFRSLVANSPVGFLVVQGRNVLFMNSELERIFGKIPVPFELKKLDPLVHRDDLEAFLRLFRDDPGVREPRGEGFLRVFPHGRPRGSAEFAWLHCRAVPIRYRDRDAVLVNTIDVTKARGTERSGAGDTTKFLEQLAAGIAHEVRNPLSGINLNLSSLEKLIGEAVALDAEKRRKARRNVESLRENSARIEAVIRRVTGFSHRHAPRLVPSDLNRCIEAAIALSTTVMGPNGVRIRTELAEGLPCIQADPELLEQVLLNLLSNAGQAVSRSGGPKEIEVASGEQGGRLFVRVADSGPGVPEGIRDKIFSPFFTTRRGGTGIGLAFSRRVIAEHGGSLTVGTSRLGGAEFRIELPAARDRAEPPGDAGG